MKQVGRRVSPCGSLKIRFREYMRLKSTRTTTTSSGGVFVSPSTRRPEHDVACGHFLSPLRATRKETKADLGKRVIPYAITGREARQHNA